MSGGKGQGAKRARNLVVQPIGQHVHHGTAHSGLIDDQAGAGQGRRLQQLDHRLGNLGIVCTQSKAGQVAQGMAGPSRGASQGYSSRA
jgi:hypothetical protein